jgi:hypothetical protein
MSTDPRDDLAAGLDEIKAGIQTLRQAIKRIPKFVGARHNLSISLDELTEEYRAMLHAVRVATGVESASSKGPKSNVHPFKR